MVWLLLIVVAVEIGVVMKKFVSILSLGSLVFAVSCGTDRKFTTAEHAPVEVETSENKPVIADEKPSTEGMTPAELEKVVPSEEALSNFANSGAVAGLLVDVAVNSAHSYIKKVKDTTVGQILEQNGQNFEDYVKTPAGYVYEGAADVTKDYWASFLNFYGLND